MAKKTKAEILNIISEMDASGEKITVRAVREKVGGGSLGDIAPIVKDYQSSHSVESAPERVYEALSGVADRIWHDAMAIAKDTWAGERMDLTGKVEDLEAQLEELEADNIRKDESISELKEDKQRADERAEAIRRETNTDADKKVQAMSHDLSKARVAIGSLEAEVKSKNETITMLEKMLSGFQQQNLDLGEKKKTQD